MISEDILNSLKKFNPEAIALWGSYGMGFNDRYTHDIDISIYVTKLPNENLKRKVLKKISDKELKLPYGGDFFIKERIYEISFILCKDIENKINDLKEGNFYAENDVAVFVKNTKTLFDIGWLKSQKSKIRNYPSKLFESNIKRNLLLAFRKISHYERALNKRKKPIWSEYIINRGINHLIRALFALNKTYYGKDKWIDHELSKFKIKPKNFEQKTLSLLKSRDIELYKKLVMEIYNLCKKYYPKESKSVLDTHNILEKLDTEVESFG